MGKSRKKYELQFKKSIVKRYHEGESVAELEIKYGISKSNINRWIVEYSPKVKVNKDNDIQNYSQHDIKQLERKIADLEEANEILKKAMTMFVK